jgi:hypothetical protein
MSVRSLIPVRSLVLAAGASLALVATASASKPRCEGGYDSAELQRFLPLARLALSLPSTESVALGPSDECIHIAVRSWGSGRLVKLILRGVAVPRAAVQVDVLPEPKAART